MPNDPTFSELYKAKAILEEELDAAVEAFMTDPSTGRFAIGDVYTADLAAAVAEGPFACSMVENPRTQLGSKRSAVRTAILLARPVKGG